MITQINFIDQYFIKQNNFKGKKLLLNDAKRKRLLRSSYEQKSKIKQTMQLTDKIFDYNAKSDDRMFNTPFQVVIKKHQMLNVKQRQNHDKFIKQRAKSSTQPLKTISSFDRRESLIQKFEQCQYREKILNKTIIGLIRTQSQKPKNNIKIHHQYCSNPFFKSYKSKRYRENKRMNFDNSQSLSYSRQCSSQIKYRTNNSCQHKNYHFSLPQTAQTTCFNWK